MSVFDTFECNNCGREFAAQSGANAAENGYCSPRCETEGEGLT